MTERDPVERAYPPAGVINYNDVRAVLAAACSELAGRLDKSDEVAIEDGLRYSEVSAIARLLGARMNAAESACFDPIFEAVERCLLWGSYEAVELVMVGLLEDLQNANITRLDDYAQWEPTFDRKRASPGKPCRTCGTATPARCRNTTGVLGRDGPRGRAS